MATSFTEITLKTIQSQYSASHAMVALITSFGERLDPDEDINLFYEKYFNPYTAVGVGLDCWGRLVGVGREIYVNSLDFFGFLGQGLQPFDQSPFYTESASEGVVSLSDDAYRWLIFYKASANIGTEDMAKTNELLVQLMSINRDDATCYVLETNPMEVLVVFEFFLEEFERALFEKYGFLNKSGGVGVSMYEVDSSQTLGFDGSGLQPFGQGFFNVYDVKELTI